MTTTRSALRLAAICSAVCMAVTPAWSTNNASAIGTIQQLFQYSPSLGVQGEDVFFSLSNQPSTSCQSTGFFAMTPTTVTDAQTRKNFFAMLLYAKATGAQIQVSYDSTGAFCDNNAIGIYIINLVP